MNQPLAYIHPGAKIATNVVVEPFTTIYNDVGKVFKFKNQFNEEVLIEVESYELTDNAIELEWLTSRFPDGKYVDIEGLCKITNRAEIADNDYSLTPGRYVGVEDQIDYDFDYESEMGIIKDELQELNTEANILAAQIQTNLNELGL